MPPETPKPTRGVQVTLDRPRFMRYSLGTIRKIREEFGADALEKGLSGGELAKVLWYGLIGDDPSLTPADVEEMIDLENLKDVLDVMNKALGYRSKASVAQDPTPPAPTVESGGAGV